MITKDKRTMCDSCGKEIVGEANTVASIPTGWGKTRKPTHFHLTPLDCANATEPVKIYHVKSVHANERRGKSD
jgi:hypothetical protein